MCSAVSEHRETNLFWCRKLINSLMHTVLAWGNVNWDLGVDIQVSLGTEELEGLEFATSKKCKNFGVCAFKKVCVAENVLYSKYGILMIGLWADHWSWRS